ncbi:hypothetical protein THMIRHAM_05530 [Thiomicrorhabdus immobilis]|uniref:Uncharacterized protein n=2 Tax=Thiomicrorhabdus immobilis TaxID=2791037 RepID=A0ABM7MBM6_9GAMM|nr:hypothetical protein THMIRHAM_05530 [Thiomicrorhabdus immobilis]
MYSFFVDPSIFFNEIIGMPNFLTLAEELPVDKKTLRKMLKCEIAEEGAGQKENKGKVSLKTCNRVKEFVETSYGLKMSEILGDSVMPGKTNILQHGHWKSFLAGIRHSSKNKKSFFLDQIERILDADNKIFQQCMQNKDSLESHQLFWGTELAKQLLEPWGLKDTPGLDRHTAQCNLGAMSLNLYLIASYEIGMKQKHGVSINRQSLVLELLPTLVDEKIEWPIKKITDYWSVKFDVSVNTLGEYLPIISGLESDSKDRKLDAWRSGKNQPQMYSEDSIFEWLETFCPDSKSVHQEFVRFQTVLLIQRFFNFLLKRKSEQEWLVKAFDIYRVHYKDNFNRFSG